MKGKADAKQGVHPKGSKIQPRKKPQNEARTEWQARQQRGREAEEGLQVDLLEELVHLRHLAKLSSTQLVLSCLITIIVTWPRPSQSATVELQPCIRGSSKPAT